MSRASSSSRTTHLMCATWISEKDLDKVTTCDHIHLVKTKKSVKYPPHMPQMMELKETVALPGWGLTIPVRAAKAKLSALLEVVSQGQEVVITSGGKPKAKVVPMATVTERRGFQPDWDLLKSMPVQTEPPLAEDLIRADRDGRGW